MPDLGHCIRNTSEQAPNLTKQKALRTIHVPRRYPAQLTSQSMTSLLSKDDDLLVSRTDPLSPFHYSPAVPVVERLVSFDPSSQRRKFRALELQKVHITLVMLRNFKVSLNWRFNSGRQSVIRGKKRASRPAPPKRSRARLVNS
ncbi:hypothetical protein TNCV_313981 [Trichonephila clavipes]|nr:hypothetical protein TNCV_313981 [Trichonephila clavipes]